MKTQPAAPAAPAQPQDVLPRVEGWRNYPTWAVNLWLNNEQPLYHQLQDMIVTAAVDPNPRATLEASLKDWLLEQGDEPPSLTSELFTWCVEYVDFADLADHYLEDFGIERPDDLNPEPRTA